MALFKFEVDIDSLVGEVLNMNTLFKLKELYEMGAEGKYLVLQFCMQLGIISSKYTCPICRNDMSLVKRIRNIDGYEWTCQEKIKNKHSIQRSVRSGSWFTESKLSMVDILVLTEFFVLQRPQNDCLFECELSSYSVADWRQFYREVCTDFCIENSQKIGGVGVVIEIVELEFKRKFNRGMAENGNWILCGLEGGESQKCFMQVIPARDQHTLLNIIKEWVLPGTTIISDCWKAYDCLEDVGFVHLKANHLLNFVDPSSRAFTDSVEGTWSAAKRCMPRRKAEGSLAPYLSEYIWQRRIQNSKDPLREFIKEIVKVYPPSTEDVLEEN